MSTLLQSMRGASVFVSYEPMPNQPVQNQHDSYPNNDGWNETIDELLRICRYEADWDREGSDAPDKQLVHFAIQLAQQLRLTSRPAPDRVHAGVNGTIFFEWYMPEGYFEMEVTAPYEVESIWIGKGSDSAQGVLSTRAN